MQDRHKRNNTASIRPQPPIFTLSAYKSHDHKEQYIQDLLSKACIRLAIAEDRMNVKELGEVVGEAGIGLKGKELHQLYLYATYEREVDLKRSQRKVAAVVSLNRQAIDLGAVAKWIQRKIEKNKINFDAINPEVSRNKIKPHNTQSCEIKTPTESKLPAIKTRPAQIFTSEVTKVIGIFSQMQKQRQNAGLEPVCLSEDEEDSHDMPVKQIHYDGDFFEVNEKLFKLRNEAERRIEKVIEAAKHDKKLKQKFEEALMRYQRVRTEANEKIGKCGAMKAQKRMVERRKAEIKELDRWREKTNQTQFSTKYY